MIPNEFHGFRLPRSEEHTPELQSPNNLVCRLLLEKKKLDAPRGMRLDVGLLLAVVGVLHALMTPACDLPDIITRLVVCSGYLFAYFFFLKIGPPHRLNPFPHRGLFPD